MVARFVSVAFLIFSFVTLFLTNFQGIDVSDEGFWLSNAKYIFLEPESVLYSFGYWLSVVISGAVCSIFGSRLIVMRLMAFFSVVGICLISYNVYKRFVDRWVVLIGLAWGALLTYGDVTCFYGDSCTAFFYVAISALLISSFHTDNLHRATIKYIGSGVLMGLAMFCKLPNLCDVAFLLLPPICLLVVRRFTWWRIVIIEWLMLIGCLLGVVSMLFLAYRLGHLPLFPRMFALFSKIGSEGHHSPMRILSILGVYYGKVLICSIAILFMSFFVGLIQKFPHCKINLVSILLGCAYAVFFLWMNFRFSGFRFFRLFPVALFFIGFLVAMKCSRNVNNRVVWVAAMACLVLLPMGSDVPFNANKYCMPFVMPLACMFCFQCGSRVFSFARRMPFDFELVCRGMAIFFCGVVLSTVIFMTTSLRDYPNRLLLKESTDIPALMWVHTTADRADELSSIIKKINSLADEDSRLLAFPCFPLVYAAANRIPYIEGSWSRLYTSKQFAMQMDRARKKCGDRLPIVLEEKWNTSLASWPYVRKLYVEENTDLKKSQIYLRKFLEENHYRIVFEDDDFRLYISGQR